jgi:putative NADH-flavin reductase
VGTSVGVIVRELEDRGHFVTADVRPGSQEPDGEVKGVELDPMDASSVAKAAVGCDAAVSALGGARAGAQDLLTDVVGPLLAGLEGASSIACWRSVATGA